MDGDEKAVPEDEAALAARLRDPADPKLPVFFRKIERFDFDADAPMLCYDGSDPARALGYACGAWFDGYRPVSKPFAAVASPPEPAREPASPASAAEHAERAEASHERDDSLVFLLFACNLVVHGARRSTICDVQRGDYYFISHAVETMLTRDRGRTLGELRQRHEPSVIAVLDMLERLELGFFTDEPADRFPELTLRCDSPERIYDAIIDVDADSTHDYAELLAGLDELGCKVLQLRHFDPVEPAAVAASLEPSKRGGLRAIQLVVPDGPAWTIEAVRELCTRHPRISSVTLHGASQDCVLLEGRINLVCFRQRLRSANDCGEVHPGYVRVRLEHVAEAQGFDTCLHRKLGIDARGQVRNCPAHPRSFGPASKRRLPLIVDDESFRRPWSIAKDQIEVCKDCELRRVCSDCRVFRCSDDPLAKPAKCRYDPYTATLRP